MKGFRYEENSFDGFGCRCFIVRRGVGRNGTIAGGGSNGDDSSSGPNHTGCDRRDKNRSERWDCGIPSNANNAFGKGRWGHQIRKTAAAEINGAGRNHRKACQRQNSKKNGFIAERSGSG